MSELLAGGCQCGAVRYEAAGSGSAYCCHCRECQKQSASAFGVSVPVEAADFAVSGPLGKWTRATDSGSSTDCFFCTKCGTRVYHSGHSRPEMVTVKGGTFDDPSGLTIRAHIWVKRKVAWLSLPGDLPHWDTQPQTAEEWQSLRDGKTNDV